MRTEKQDYVSLIYNEKDKPFTEYPDLLAEYLTNRFELKRGNKMLDLGCGRGDFLRGFMRQGLKGYGVDNCDSAKKICPDAEITVADLTEIPFPYEENTFDCIFSKSVIEHFYYPEKLVAEAYRILKPGGKVIFMTPDWEVIYKMFYEDFTHRSPFTRKSLENILLIHGFEKVSCEKFRQLPFLWHKNYLQPLAALIALCTPDLMKKKSKLVRFAKEMMLLAAAGKPDTDKTES